MELPSGIAVAVLVCFGISQQVPEGGQQRKKNIAASALGPREMVCRLSQEWAARHTALRQR